MECATLISGPVLDPPREQGRACAQDLYLFLVRPSSFLSLRYLSFIWSSQQAAEIS